MPRSSKPLGAGHQDTRHAWTARPVGPLEVSASGTPMRSRLGGRDSWKAAVLVVPLALLTIYTSVQTVASLLVIQKCSRQLTFPEKFFYDYRRAGHLKTRSGVPHEKWTGG